MFNLVSKTKQSRLAHLQNKLLHFYFEATRLFYAILTLNPIIVHEDRPIQSVFAFSKREPWHAIKNRHSNISICLVDMSPPCEIIVC